MRKISRKSLKLKADKLFAQKIRSKEYCQLAGLDRINCSGVLQCMHIVGRANHALRWDSLNALCGCSGHHIFYTAHPTEFAMLIEENFPDRWTYLQANRNEIWDKDIDRVINELKDWRPND